MRWVLLLLGLGCKPADAPPRELPDPPAPAALAAYLEEVAAYPPAARAEAMRGWQLQPAAWNRIVVPVFRDAYPAYTANFAAATAALAAQLHAGTITARRHYAGDPHATPGELWLRWAVPTLYPSVVAELDGKPLDAVFLYDDHAWRTLAGLDRAISDAATALDPDCAGYLRAAGVPACAEVDYLIAESAMRTDRAAFTRACSLAATRCGKRSPP